MNYGDITYSRLSSHTALTDIVGTRIANTKAEQGYAMPYLVFRHSLTPIYTHMGGGSSPIKQHEVYVEIRVVTHEDQAITQAFTIAEEVVSAMVLYTGVDILGHHVKNILWKGYDPQVYNEEIKGFETPMNFTMTINL